MQSEEFDSKVKEAAENHHPAYDENAWARMEKLLNKHLPQEKDGRRRIIFFLLLFLMIGGGSVWLFSSKPWRGNKQAATAKTMIQKPTGDKPAPVSSNKENPTGENDKLNKEEIAGIIVSDNSNTISSQAPPDQIPALLHSVNKNDRQNNIPVKTGVNNKKIKTAQPVLSFNNNPDPTDKNIKKDWMDRGQVDAATTTTTAATLIPDEKNNKNDVVADKNLISKTTIAKPVVNDQTEKVVTNKDNTSMVQNSPEKKIKGKSKKGNTFFFTLSTGPDISFTGSDKPGKVKLLVGGGLGYTIKDRLTIRSGFYTGRKVYTSSPGSYHPPASFWNYYPNLEKVEADCKVYEIPLSFSYNFGHTSKQNWFASTGISSYLMKNETYKYYYKYTPTGSTVTRSYSPRDKNNHYFSVITLSGGYQKNIGKSLFIMAEPYFKIPLSGVGFGKVKLNSGGVLFSVGIKPFAGSGKHSNPRH